MKKPRPTKLNLHRETLRHLADEEAVRAKGGRPTTSDACSPDCMVSERNCF